MGLWPDNNPLQSAPFQFDSIASEYEDKAVGSAKALGEIAELVDGYGAVHIGPDVDTIVALGGDVVEGLGSSVSGYEEMGVAFRAASMAMDRLAVRETAWRAKVAGLDPDAVSEVESGSAFSDPTGGYELATESAVGPSEAELQAVRDAAAEYDSIRADEDAALGVLAGAIAEVPTGSDIVFDVRAVSELLGRLAGDVAAADWVEGLTIGQAVLRDHADGEIDGTAEMFESLVGQGLGLDQIDRVVGGEFDDYWTDRIIDEGLHPEVVDVAIDNDVPYPDAEWAVLGNSIEQLQTAIDDWDENPIPGVELHEVFEERNKLVDRLTKGDQKLAGSVRVALHDGVPIDEAIGLAATETYGDAPIGEIMQAQEPFVDSEGNPYVFAFELQGVLIDQTETFTGVDIQEHGESERSHRVGVEDVDFGIAAEAERQGISYNHMVTLLQMSDPADLPEGFDVPLLLDVPVRDDAEAAARLAVEDYTDGDAFTEIETALEGNVEARDGKFSTADIEAVLADPDNFSAEAVALATFLDENPEVRRHMDVASEGRFLEDLDEGRYDPAGDGDGTVSRADVAQYQVNVATFEALNTAREQGLLGVPERDGQYTTAQLAELRESLPDPGEKGPSSEDEYLAAVIDQTIENNWLDNRDNKTKVANSLATIGFVLNPATATRPVRMDDPNYDPSNGWQDHINFGKGIGDFAVSAYDLGAALSPEVGRFEALRSEAFDTDDRGAQTREGLRQMPETLGSLAWWTEGGEAAREEMRRSGRWDSHEGLAAVSSVVDVETFLNDPARWAGQMAPEVVLTVVTGGTGAAATRATKVGTSVIKATRYTARHGTKQAVKQGLKLTGEGLKAQGKKSRVWITDKGQVVVNTGQNMAETYRTARAWVATTTGKTGRWAKTRARTGNQTPDALITNSPVPNSVVHRDHPTTRKPERWVLKDEDGNLIVDENGNLVVFRWKIEKVEAPEISQGGEAFVHPTSWVQDINGGGTHLPGRSNNCLDCARAVEARWRGADATAAPHSYPSDLGAPGILIENWSGRKISNRGNTVDIGPDLPVSGQLQKVQKELEDLGPGSSMILTVKWTEDAGGGGHAFNAVNHNGKVLWIDGQDGTYGQWPPPTADDIEGVWAVGFPP